MTTDKSARAELHRLVENGHRVSVDTLLLEVKNIFEALGLSFDDANAAAQTIIYADIRGIDSHGVSTILPRYVNKYLAKTINPRPNIKINKTTKTAAFMDADNALGVIAVPKAVDTAIEISRDCGVGIVAVQNAGHAGALGHHALLAAKNDMIGLVMAAGKGLMVPPFGSSPLLGTNPIALAVPANKMPPFVFDAATTAICGNKIRLAEILDVAISPGWIFGENNTVDQQYNEWSLPALLPLGSTYDLGAHKGFGFGMMAEIFCNTFSSSLSFSESSSSAIGHFVIVFRIDAFGSVDDFKARMDILLRTVAEAPPEKENGRVFYAGLRAHEMEQHRRNHGIPLQPRVIQWFHQVAAHLNLSCKLPLPSALT